MQKIDERSLNNNDIKAFITDSIFGSLTYIYPNHLIHSESMMGQNVCLFDQ